MTRRAALGGMAALPLLAVSGKATKAQGEVRATDVVGREIVLREPARRLVLGPWVTLDALSLIHPDPTSLIVGWGGDGGANHFQLDGFRDLSPAIDEIPVVARNTIETMSVETVIALAPDLVVLSRLDAFRFGPTASNPQLDQLEAAGIPVAIVDFFLDPVANTEQSMRVLGHLIGREREAEAFLDFYAERMRRIETRLVGVERPTVLFHAFAGRPECCWTTGPGQRDGLMTPAGAHNIGEDALIGTIGQLSLEYVYEHAPRFYVATGGGDAPPAEDTFTIGRGVTREQAEKSFAALLDRPHISAIGAVEAGRAFAIWHNFVHTPVRVAAVEALARWFHPDLFSDVDADATLDAINERFLAVPLSGTLWLSA